MTVPSPWDLSPDSSMLSLSLSLSSYQLVCHKMRVKQCPDGLHPRVLCETSDAMAETWTQLFRSSVDSGILPSDWRVDEIVPIFKKGLRTSPLNYRPVTLTAVPGKVLESLIRDQLMEHLIRTGQLSGEQHGFRPKRS